MVIEVLNSWEQLFHAIDVARGDRIDAVRIRFRSEKTERMTSALWLVKSASDFSQIVEALPRVYRKYGFSQYEIGAGDDEIMMETVGGSEGVVLRVLLVTAS